MAHRDRHCCYSPDQRMASIATHGSSPHWNAARVGHGPRLCIWQSVQWVGLRSECAGPDRPGDESRSTSRLAWIRVDAPNRCGHDRVWWLYPHFLEGHATAYLYASPVGLVPCPTLAVAIGFALLGNGLGSRVWSLTLAAVGLLYGLFGVLRLGVFLDIGLVSGAVALEASVLRYPAAGRVWQEYRPRARSDRAA